MKVYAIIEPNEQRTEGKIVHVLINTEKLPEWVSDDVHMGMDVNHEALEHVKIGTEVVIDESGTVLSKTC